MTPLIPQLVKAAAIVVGAGIVLQRFRWREYPALFSWMFWEVAMQSASLGLNDVPAYMILIQDGVCAAVICEVLSRSRLTVQIGVQMRVFICVLATAKIMATLPDLTGRQEWYLFRSYFLWAAFVALAWVAMYREINPVLERKADRAYRLGALAWLFVRAVAGSFVKGGVGYLLFPYTMATWKAAHLASCLGMAVAVIGMSAAMYNAAPGRKHAAKDHKGKTKTGLIEMERAA